MQKPSIEIVAVDDVGVLESLRADADANTCRIVRRLIGEWQSGENRFDRPGERLYIANEATKILGVCGLNIDPFANESRVARVRRLYVHSHYRRVGIGRRLMSRLIQDAANHFHTLHLRTHDSVASAFYQSLGFEKVVDESACTHRLRLVPPLPRS
jgi:GNAT superfamily N-acetyltransferase